VSSLKGSRELYSNCGVLLILYNRVQLTSERIRDLSKFSRLNVNLFISIDASKNEGVEADQCAEVVRIAKRAALELGANFFLEPSNKGCDQHIPRAIGRVLEKCEAVFVIEDDICIGVTALGKCLEKIEDVISKNGLEPVIGMSGISLLLGEKLNSWRRSQYFSPWGYGINRDFWEKHKKLEQRRTDAKVVSLRTPTNSYFERMDKRKKDIWLERCYRGNYDYSIQATMFELNLQAIAPISRVIDNEGFGLSNSTHTRFLKPRFLEPVIRETSGFALTTEVKNIVFNSFMNWVDTITWAGDSRLSLRGRTSGVRTILNRIFARKKYARD